MAVGVGAGIALGRFGLDPRVIALVAVGVGAWIALGRFGLHGGLGVNDRRDEEILSAIRKVLVATGLAFDVDFVPTILEILLVAGMRV